jgi:hypothetical protein
MKPKGGRGEQQWSALKRSISHLLKPSMNVIVEEDERKISWNRRERGWGVGEGIEREGSKG